MKASLLHEHEGLRTFALVLATDDEAMASLDSVATLRRLVAIYVHEHNHVLPHSAFRGQTPDEMYFGTGNAVAADLSWRLSGGHESHVVSPVATTSRPNNLRRATK